MSDNGLALGAALHVAKENRFQPEVPTTVYFGPDYSDREIFETLRKHNLIFTKTEFMPFAPVTLERYADKCYKNLKGVEYPTRFMTITLDTTSYLKRVSPAVVHVDGTARPQIIRREDNPSYYKILMEYCKLTSIPTLINTSFNMHEEPIVCTPDDAIRSFLTGRIDFLAIGNYLVSCEENSE